MPFSQMEISGRVNERSKAKPDDCKGKEGIRCELRESDGGQDSRRRGMDKLAYPLTLASTAAATSPNHHTSRHSEEVINGRHYSTRKRRRRRKSSAPPSHPFARPAARSFYPSDLRSPFFGRTKRKGALVGQWKSLREFKRPIQILHLHTDSADSRQEEKEGAKKGRPAGEAVDPMKRL